MMGVRDRLRECERQISDVSFMEGELHKRLRLLLAYRARLVRLLKSQNKRRRL